MSEVVTKTHKDFVLPLGVVNKIDVSHLVTEFERVDNELTAASVHAKVGSPTQTQPMVSRLLADFLSQNTLSLDDGHQRSELIRQLRLLKDSVPVIHMTFAVEADHESLQQLVQWLRATIHPQAVIAVGLQPALVAGVYLRTANHVHDFSLRAALKGGHGVLMKELEVLRASS